MYAQYADTSMMKKKRAYRLLNYLMDGRVPYVGPTKGHLHRRLLRNQPLLL